MRVTSTMALILYYVALILISVVVDVPNRGTLFNLVTSQFNLFTVALMLVLLVAPVVLLVMVHSQASSLQVSAFEKDRLDGNAKRLLLALGQIGKTQFALSLDAAQAKQELPQLSELESLMSALAQAETDTAAVETFLADPSKYKPLLDELAARQAAVKAKLSHAIATLSPLKDTAAALDTRHKEVLALLQKLGGPEQVIAISQSVAAAEKSIADYSPVVAQAETFSAPIAKHITSLKVLRDRLDALLDKDNGVQAVGKKLVAAIDEVKGKLQKLETTESAEPVAIKLAVAEAAVHGVETRVKTLEECTAPMSKLRASIERLKGRVSQLADDNGLKAHLQKIEASFAALEKTLRTLEVTDKGEKVGDVVMQITTRLEQMQARVVKAEELGAKLLGLRGEVDTAATRIGVSAPNGELRKPA